MDHHIRLLLAHERLERLHAEASQERLARSLRRLESDGPRLRERLGSLSGRAFRVISAGGGEVDGRAAGQSGPSGSARLRREPCSIDPTA